MREVKLTRQVWTIGLFVLLFSCSLANANEKVKEPLKISPSLSSVDDVKRESSAGKVKSESSATEVHSDKKGSARAKPASTSRNCACSCSAAAATAGGGSTWWQCTQGCLRSWGVSPLQLVACGTACGLGVVPACAICIGANATVFMLCAIGCEVYAEDPHNPNHGPILTKLIVPRNKTRKAAHTKLTLLTHR